MQLNINGKAIEVSNDDLKKALEENKESFDLKPEGIILRTTEEDSTFSENLRKEGISTGAEIGRKEVLKGLGIEGEGLHKTDLKSIDSINSFITGRVEAGLKDANIEPDKKVVELNNDIKTLQGTILSLTGERDTARTEHTTFKTNLSKERSVRKAIPDNTVIPKDAMLKLLMSEVRTDVDENGVTFGIGSDGQPLKDATTLAKLSIDKVVSNYFDSNAHYLKASTGGGGGGDSDGTGGKQSLEAFTKEMGEAQHSPNSPMFNQIMGERIKAGTIAI